MVRTDSASDDCSDERDGSNWSSRMSINRMKHELGLLSWDRSATSGYNGRRAAFSDLFRCRSTEWSTIVSMLHRRVSPPSDDLTQWDANLVFFLLLSSLFLQNAKPKKRKTECFCSKRWNDGRQREGEHPTLWYQLLGMRPPMWKITQHPEMKKNLRVGEATQNMHTQREREAQSCMSY